MSIRRLKCINIHFIHNIQNRHRDVESSSGIDTLYTIDFRRILDVTLYTIYRIDTEMLSQVREYGAPFVNLLFRPDL